MGYTPSSRARAAFFDDSVIYYTPGERGCKSKNCKENVTGRRLRGRRPERSAFLQFVPVGGAIEGGEVVRRGLGAADELVRAALHQQHLGAAQFAVVVVAHGEAVGAGVVDDHHVADLDLGQGAVHSELVVVLA